MSEEKNLQLASSLSTSAVTSADLANYNIPITIRNASSVGFQKAEVAVKDEGSNTVASAYFGHINSHSTATETVQLPGGIESCVYRITPDVGEDILGGGLANNAPGVNITISD